MSAASGTDAGEIHPIQSGWLTCSMLLQVVNRLQRELETVLSNYRVLEKRLEAEGIDLRSISQLSPLSTDTECAPTMPWFRLAAHTSARRVQPDCMPSSRSGCTSKHGLKHLCDIAQVGVRRAQPALSRPRQPGALPERQQWQFATQQYAERPRDAHRPLPQRRQLRHDDLVTSRPALWFCCNGTGSSRLCFRSHSPENFVSARRRSMEGLSFCLHAQGG